jgi:hypothetical protein
MTIEITIPPSYGLNQDFSFSDSVVVYLVNTVGQINLIKITIVICKTRCRRRFVQKSTLQEQKQSNYSRSVNCDAWQPFLAKILISPFSTIRKEGVSIYII